MVISLIIGGHFFFVCLLFLFLESNLFFFWFRFFLFALHSNLQSPISLFFSSLFGSLCAEMCVCAIVGDDENVFLLFSSFWKTKKERNKTNINLKRTQKKTKNKKKIKNTKRREYSRWERKQSFWLNIFHFLVKKKTIEFYSIRFEISSRISDTSLIRLICSHFSFLISFRFCFVLFFFSIRYHQFSFSIVSISILFIWSTCFYKYMCVGVSVWFFRFVSVSVSLRNNLINTFLRLSTILNPIFFLFLDSLKNFLSIGKCLKFFSFFWWRIKAFHRSFGWKIAFTLFLDPVPN